MKSVCIGMATTGTVKTLTVSCLTNLIKATQYPTELLLKSECHVHYSREKMARYAIQKNFSHLLFVDSDMSFSPDALNQLMARDKDIVGVDSHIKSLEKISTVKLHEGKTMIFEPNDDLFECCAVGAGFMLIATKIFKKIPRPWFFFKESDGHLISGEDVWFCRAARKEGFRVWCDATVKVGHIGDYEY